MEDYGGLWRIMGDYGGLWGIMLKPSLLVKALQVLSEKNEEFSAVWRGSF
ncbi:MAG: hypothetical protein KatS3mg030_351 [Saprospiraceae bacterium]|nr:MAG: hypothetical protein KatS3mg030_351 [Saprospiraceae bacterium]